MTSVARRVSIDDVIRESLLSRLHGARAKSRDLWLPKHERGDAERAIRELIRLLDAFGSDYRGPRSSCRLVEICKEVVGFLETPIYRCELLTIVSELNLVYWVAYGNEKRYCWVCVCYIPVK